MNQWYYDIAILMILLVMIVGIIVCVVSIIVQTIRKRSKKSFIISIAVDLTLLVVTLLHYSSHSTYYKFNDWVILQSNIYDIEQKYGSFDLGEMEVNQKGEVAYYIYTDNGPIMPDYLKHYYYIEYDERGAVYNVYNSCQRGG